MRDGDEHHLLPCLRRRQLELAQAAILRRELDWVSANGVVRANESTWRAPVDAIRLRGVPVVGHGSAGGAIRGTRPDVALIENLDRLDHGRVGLLVERGC